MRQLSSWINVAEFCWELFFFLLMGFMGPRLARHRHRHRRHRAINPLRLIDHGGGGSRSAPCFPPDSVSLFSSIVLAAAEHQRGHIAAAQPSQGGTSPKRGKDPAPPLGTRVQQRSLLHSFKREVEKKKEEKIMVKG